MKRKVVLLLLLSLLTLAASARKIQIWKGTQVAAPGVTLTPYLPERTAADAPSPAVVICPGGSYFWLDLEHEGRMVARWLQEQGFAAFLLEYRTAGWFNFAFHTRSVLRGHHYPAMVEDIQRAIQLVRENAAAYDVNPGRIGAMGFSAGGHLVMLSAVLCDMDFLAPLGVECKVSLRPDFVAPIYPVVTLEDREFVHCRSRRGLLGVDNESDKALRALLSVERHVTGSTPPVFLLNCLDDPVVDYRNAELLDSALTANKVRHSYVQYQKGGHGFGADRRKFSDETSRWQETFITWIKSIFDDEE